MEKLQSNLHVLKRVESFGSSVKSIRLDRSGLNVSHDLSNLSLRQSIVDGKFWHIWLMVLFSMVYGYFTKVAFKSYGSTIYDDD